MCYFGKTQGVGNFGDVPIAMFQQYFCFLQNSFSDDLRRCFLSRFLQCPIQMIDVNKTPRLTLFFPFKNLDIGLTHTFILFLNTQVNGHIGF